jgi:tripartite-type tricarboxylate transporter receptor subunit TctC
MSVLARSCLAAAAMAACVAQAQNFPSKTLRMVTGGVGGGSDFTLRLIAQGLVTPLGQQVVVENRGGASGAIAIQAVSRAAPDGHTLLYYSSSLWIIPLLQDVSWDVNRDLVPITLAAVAPNLVVVHPSLPAKTIRELIALGKARPGALNYGSGVTGSSLHLAAELFKYMAGVNITQISYKGAGPAVNDLISGQLQLMFASAGSVAPHVKSGRLRALGVTSAKPSPVAPGVPTVASSGLPGFETGAAYAMFAPPGTPAAVVARLQQESVKIINDPEMKEKFITSGVEAVASTPEELTNYMRSEVNRLGKTIKAANIRAD